MANAVLMPKAGITVESCIIGKWEKKVGDQIAEGDILFTYETDKAAFECESTAAGELLEIFFSDGEEVPCLVNVCAIGTKGEDVSALRPDGAAPAAAVAAGPEYEDVKFSGIRRAISKSMHNSLTSMAQLTHNFSFDASAILAYRKMLKESGGECAGITIGDLILYAVSRVLPGWPDLNAHMLDDVSIRKFNHVNLGVAVDTPRGLIVPTIMHADEKSLLEISNELKVLAAEARDGAISPDKLTGASFTVSNLGGFGVESFTPVINPPQTGILGVCTTVQRPRKGADGSIQLYPAMALSLTYDHRAIDGAPASRFVQELCKQLEHFTVLLAK